MVQVQIDLIGATLLCKYCDKKFKSQTGLMNHIHKIHPLDLDSDVHCWTCNKPFTKRQLLYHHYETVLHQLNCKKLNEGEIPVEEKNTQEDIIMKRPYQARLFERRIKQVPYRKTDRKYLGKNPAIILLEATVKLQDLRGAPKVSFLDVCDLMEEELSDPTSDPGKMQKFPEVAEKIVKSQETEDIKNQQIDVTLTTDLKQEISDSLSKTEKNTDPNTMSSTSRVSTVASSEIEVLHLLLDSLSQVTYQ